MTTTPSANAHRAPGTRNGLPVVDGPAARTGRRTARPAIDQSVRVEVLSVRDEGGHPPVRDGQQRGDDRGVLRSRHLSPPSRTLGHGPPCGKGRNSRTCCPREQCPQLATPASSRRTRWCQVGGPVGHDETARRVAVPVTGSSSTTRCRGTLTGVDLDVTVDPCGASPHGVQQPARACGGCAAEVTPSVVDDAAEQRESSWCLLLVAGERGREGGVERPCPSFPVPVSEPRRPPFSRSARASVTDESQPLDRRRPRCYLRRGSSTRSFIGSLVCARRTEDVGDMIVLAAAGLDPALADERVGSAHPAEDQRPRGFDGLFGERPALIAHCTTPDERAARAGPRPAHDAGGPLSWRSCAPTSRAAHSMTTESITVGASETRAARPITRRHAAVRPGNRPRSSCSDVD